MSTNNSEKAYTLGEYRLKAFDERLFKVETAFNFVAAMFILGIMFLGVANVIGRTLPRSVGIILNDMGFSNFVTNYDYLFLSRPVRGYVDIVEIAVTVFASLDENCKKIS